MKNLLHTLLLLYFLLQFTSCTDYDGETKFVYEGRVLDASGNPLQGVPLSIKISRTSLIIVFPFGVHETDIISYTNTNENGYFKMVFPKPIGSSSASLLVNYDNPATAAKPTLSSTVVYNILEQNNTDFKINFSDSKLYDVANSVPLTLQFNSQSGGGIRKINLEGLVRENYIDYNLDLVEEGHNAWINNLNNVVQVATNQILTIKYQVQEQNGNITVQEAQVQINDQPLTYQLIY